MLLKDRFSEPALSPAPVGLGDQLQILIETSFAQTQQHALHKVEDGEYSPSETPWMYRADRTAWAYSDNCMSYLVNRPKSGHIEPGDRTARLRGLFESHTEHLQDLSESAPFAQYHPYIMDGLEQDGFIRVSEPETLITNDYTVGILFLRDRDTFFSPDVDYPRSDYHWITPVLDAQGGLHLQQKAPTKPVTRITPVSGETPTARMMNIMHDAGYKVFGGFHAVHLNPKSPHFVDYQV